MHLIRLIYCSYIDGGLTDEDLQTLLDQSRENNHRLGISGLLVFNRDYFLQLLEGERERVSETYTTIARDPRHHNPVLLGMEEISERTFADWHMGYVPESGLTEDVLFRFSRESQFEPMAMTYPSVLGMMKALRETVPLRDT